LFYSSKLDKEYESNFLFQFLYIQGLTNQFQNELDTLKKYFEDINKVKYDVQNVSKECSKTRVGVEKILFINQ